MSAEPQRSQNEKSAAFFEEMLGEDWHKRSREIALEAGKSLGKTVTEMDDPAFRLGMAEALGKASNWPAPEELASIRQTVADLTRPQPMALPPSSQRQPAKRARRRVKPIPLDEQIARRVLKRHRSTVVIFLKKAGLAGELKELEAVEKRIAEGSHQAAKHAAFSARNLMEGVADRLLQPTSEKRLDRDGREHSLGGKDHKNRLIAYAEDQLKGKWEGHEFRAFVGTMDLVMRWTASGPHGAYKLQEAEHLYTRMLDALAVIASAYEEEPA